MHARGERSEGWGLAQVLAVTPPSPPFPGFRLQKGGHNSGAVRTVFINCAKHRAICKLPTCTCGASFRE